MSDIPSPRENTRLIGHRAAELAFLDAWGSGRLAHAWLISGPKGIGKASLAFRIARFVLSGGGDGGSLFGGPPSHLDIAPEHPVFRRIAASAHADLKVVERGWSDDKKSKRRSEIVVDDVRGIGGFMALTAAEGGWRVVIIDAADEMNRNAANAVLKVLEEPPRKALMLLISHSPGRLLPTIRSRCRRLPLAPLPEEDVAHLLSEFSPHIPSQDRTILARLSEGSPGKALALAEEGGMELYAELAGFLGQMPRPDIPALHGMAERLSRPEADQAWRTATELLQWWLARLVRAGGLDGQGMMEVIPGEGAVMARLLAAAPLERWLQVWEKVCALFQKTDAVNLDRKQALLVAFTVIERTCRG